MRDCVSISKPTQNLASGALDKLDLPKWATTFPSFLILLHPLWTVTHWPRSVVQTPHTAGYAGELLLTFNRSDHPMFAPDSALLQVEESARLIVAFFADFSHIHQLFHLIIRSFSDRTVFLNIRSHVAYLLLEVDTKQKKTCPTLSNCAHLRSEC